VRLLNRQQVVPEAGALAVDHILLASEGRPISEAALDLAAQLAAQGGGRVHVFSVARVWGSGLGGVEATGHVLATRKATKRIVSEAERLGCGAIVMGADPPRNRVLADLMWSQEPYRVRRRAAVPVYLTG
jgi:nucleotide-binding universal stress UspA family protein